MRRTIFEEDHQSFRSMVRDFLRVEALPHTKAWEEAGMVDRAFWRKAAAQGLVGFAAPEELGGAGLRDFRFNAVIDEEVALAGVAGDGFAMANDILAPYLLDLTTAEQRERWLPGFTSGELVAAVAMSEPGAGSDLQGIRTRARREDDHYIVDGSKTFVTSGIQADLVVVVARTDPAGGRHGFTLLVADAQTPGFERGRKLDKIGRRGQDTAELFFEGARIPVENRLGEEGEGFPQLMRNLPQERLSIAVSAVAAAEHALDVTLGYVRERKAFGQPVGSFQANRFALAELTTRTAAARAYIDAGIAAAVDGSLTAEEAAGAKALATELQFEVLDRCMQLHGGYGYMEEYEIARLWRDGRVQRIYGGTTEIMYEIVGRSLGL
jgi:acyl-CoA dehydrogenase